MQKRRKVFSLCLALLGALFLFSACYYSHQDYADGWDLTPQKIDSLDFASTHHYSNNFNFVVTADSLLLQTHRPSCSATGGHADSVWVYRDNPLVVAEILICPSDTVDSVWVKVARDQNMMGWVYEKNLLQATAPNDPISLCIHLFSNQHLIYFLVCLLLVAVAYGVRRMQRKRFRMVHFDDISSPYPTLLCIGVSVAAVLYAGMQTFVPEIWTEYYFHPTLNPFGLPPVLGTFLASLWMLLIVGLAAVDDVVKQLPTGEAVTYLLSLAGMCAVCYLVFSLTTLYFVGYVLLPLYGGFALWRYIRFARCNYVCGRCGHMLQSKGRCPHCGAWNA